MERARRGRGGLGGTCAHDPLRRRARAYLPEAERRLVRDRAVLERDAGAVALVEGVEAVDECIPEAGIGPMLDGERGAERDAEVVRTVDLVQRVAKVERCRGAVTALPHVLKVEADRAANVAEPLEVGGAVGVDAALDGARRRDDARVEGAGDVIRACERRHTPMDNGEAKGT